MLRKAHPLAALSSSNLPTAPTTPAAGRFTSSTLCASLPTAAHMLTCEKPRTHLAGGTLMLSSQIYQWWLHLCEGILPLFYICFSKIRKFRKIHFLNFYTMITTFRFHFFFQKSLSPLPRLLPLSCSHAIKVTTYYRCILRTGIHSSANHGSTPHYLWNPENAGFTTDTMTLAKS